MLEEEEGTGALASALERGKLPPLLLSVFKGALCMQIAILSPGRAAEEEE